MKKHHNWGGLILVLSVSVFYVMLTVFAVWGFFYNPDALNTAKQIIVFEVLTIWIAILLVVHHFKRKSRRIAVKNTLLTLSEQTSEVSVVSKSKKTIGDRYSTSSVFYITFEMPDGERKNFQVIHDRYATIEKDDVGTLIYKEGNGFLFFVDFKRKPNKDQ